MTGIVQIHHILVKHTGEGSHRKWALHHSVASALHTMQCRRHLTCWTEGTWDLHSPSMPCVVYHKIITSTHTCAARA